jgi:hypothetical protein
MDEYHHTPLTREKQQYGMAQRQMHQKCSAPFISENIINAAMLDQRSPNRSRNKKKMPVDEEMKITKLQKIMGDKPRNIIESTIKTTTCTQHLPARPHLKHYTTVNHRNNFRVSGTVATDTLFSKIKSWKLYGCLQIFVHKPSHTVYLYPMHTKGEFSTRLQDFIIEFGSPETLHSDNSLEQTSRETDDILRKYGIKRTLTEPHHSHQNFAEPYIRIVKTIATKLMYEAQLWLTPAVVQSLWVEALWFAALIHNHTFQASLGNKTPLESLSGIQPDIGKFAFQFGQLIEYKADAHVFPDQAMKIGHFVGYAPNTGGGMVFKILTDKSTIIHRSHAREIDPKHRPPPLTIPPLPTPEHSPVFLESQPEADSTSGGENEESTSDSEEIAQSSPEVDPSQPTIPNGEYTIERMDSIQENTKINRKGKEYRTLQVWVKWLGYPDEDSSWVDIAILVEDVPDALAEALSTMVDVPKKWEIWAKRRRSKQSRTQVGAVTAHKKTREQHGVYLPRNTTEALRIDETNGNNLWRDAIRKEWGNLKSNEVFKETTAEDIVNSTRVPLIITFAVKIDGTRKCRICAGGHVTEASDDVITSSSVLKMETFKLLLTIAMSQNLRIINGDITAAYLHATTKEKVYCIAGKEFEEDDGKVLTIHKALYGLRSSGAAFHDHLANSLRDMGFHSSEGDLDLWMKTVDGRTDYIGIYVDDYIIVAAEPEIYDKMIRARYIVGRSGPLTRFIGCDVINGHDNKLYLSSKRYIAGIIKHAETNHNIIINEADTPGVIDSHPEMDESPVLTAEMKREYQSLMGKLQWALTIGRIDITYEISSLSRFNANPRANHWTAVMRILGYLKKFPDYVLVINGRTPRNTITVSPGAPSLKPLYPDAIEERSKNEPAPTGDSLNICVYVDSDHAHDQKTRRSCSGYIIFVNGTPLICKSKRQCNAESSTYAAEFSAMKSITEELIGLRYLLRSLAITVDKPSSVFGDNNAVIGSINDYGAVLKKKSHGIAFHMCRGASAADVLRSQHIRTNNNIADINTKTLPAIIYNQHRDQIMTLWKDTGYNYD